MAITTNRSYVGVQVTMADHTKTYNLLALVNAVIAAESGQAGGSVCPSHCRELKLQGPTANTGTIYVGDGLLVAAGAGRQSGEIAKGTSRTYGTGDLNNVDLGHLYVSPATDNDKLNVEVLVG